MIEDIGMVDRINYQPNVMQLVILHNIYIVFCHNDVMVCLLTADSIAPQFQMCKVVLYNIVFSWLIFRAKFDCNVVQSFVPYIYCGISL